MSSCGYLAKCMASNSTLKKHPKTHKKLPANYTYRYRDPFRFYIHSKQNL